MIETGALVADRYRLERRLEADATATTWQALDTALERQVHVRLLNADRGDDSVAVEAFLSSIRAAARSRSSSSPRVLDGGSDPGTGLPYVVWEIPDVEQPTEALPVIAPRARVSQYRPRRRGLEPLVLLLLAVPLLVGAALIWNWLSQPASVGERLAAAVAQQAQSQATPTLAPKPAAAAPTAQPTPNSAAPKPTAVPTQSVVGERRRIANTDGIGVALRASPGGERLPGKGYDEGATVTLLEQQGAWAHIRGDDGREGWVLAVTVVR